MDNKPRRSISLGDIGAEPYRVMFPAAVLSGVLGAALWPLHFGHVISLYPGQAHARIMACGLLGGFIFGFLGTAMPRMLSAPPLGVRNAAVVLVLHLAMLGCYFVQKIAWGDRLFLALLLFFLVLLAVRIVKRADIPPPGFSLVGLALLCALGGAVLGVLEPYHAEPDPYLVLLRRLLLYQGFILLPILGIGPFLLPRFFGVENPHAFPEMLVPNRAWTTKALFALSVGFLVVGSLFIEASGWHRLAHLLRFGAALVYMAIEFPFRRAPLRGAMGISLWIAFGVMLAGFLVIALFPAYRVGLLHLSLIGGFSVIAFVVATRVVYGHSGNSEQLKKPNRWLVLTVSMMLFASATRASADLWPRIQISHYVYGALIWIAAALLWSWYVLPKTMQAEEHEE